MPLTALVENGVTFWASPAEQEMRDLLRGLSAECIPLIKATWGLPLPRNCRVYVMTHWSDLMLHAAPWSLRAVNALMYLRWRHRMLRVWDLAAGLNMRYRGRPAIGVKPARLWKRGQDSIGQHLFCPLGEDGLRLRNIVCHEMTHAFASHLNLPLWLNEGIAMVTVDLFLQRETVQRHTLPALQDPPRPLHTVGYNALGTMPEKQIIAAYAYSYWTTRYLFETNPDLLRSLLAQPLKSTQLTDRIARALHIAPQKLWSELNNLVLAYFAPESG